MEESPLSDLQLILTIPVVTALVGWGTNWAAVRMIFWPAKFHGVGPVGWQGIVYRHSAKFADGVGNVLSNSLVTADLVVERIDSQAVADFVDEQFADGTLDIGTVAAACDAVATEIPRQHVGRAAL